MNTLKIYATGSATGNAVAQVIIPKAARIRQIVWAVSVDSVTDNGTLALEISKASATEIAVNQAQQCIAEVRATSNFVTSGLAHTGINVVTPVDIQTVQGQIIYLHAVVGGTLTYPGGAVLHYD